MELVSFLGKVLNTELWQSEELPGKRGGVGLLVNGGGAPVFFDGGKS